ncbi:1-aminocyclopropane-1-carboxylate oxidase homolog 1 [Phtheirospermum japonicum]|uniref:1-aminocyclopropane-1-carboxylate oxidase homolog 1 n=1 Tax=Phtheirospermum japonicum TaxID=374723 RepID=A0A830C9E0_9LAMI|nr:1-aminocyclopropane-1-carboxylate oxidase homolog 1 [Phtheirospermum japonicum]
MVVPNSTTTTSEENQITPPAEPNYDRKGEVKAFDDTKAGVKGLVDSGVARVPRIFIHPPENLQNISKNSNKRFEFPIIDLDGVNKDPVEHKNIVNKILDASQEWGFFQVVNHGIPVSVLEEMLDGVRRFHEQDDELKKPYYSRDFTKKMIYNSNFDLYSSSAASWRDSFNCTVAPNPPELQELPCACREIMLEYGKQVMELGITLFKLLSEALGLDPNHLIGIDCAQTLALFGHYYPACPEPELTDTSGVNSRVYGPIKELLSEHNSPKYRAIQIREYTSHVRARGVDGTSALQNFKL